MLKAAAFIELLFPVKYTIFSTSVGLQILFSSNTLCIKELDEETRNATTQQVILVTLVISQGYLDEIVTRPGKGNFIQRIDKELLEQLVASAMMCVNKSQGAVEEMILNWNNGRNTMFDFNLNPEEALVLKIFVRGQQIA